ncbi:MAG: hypothetical protein NTZ03_06555 [Actinobacteria bacterium]|nr:hypothetical protein [Actinomycetota bacterium]
MSRRWLVVSTVYIIAAGVLATVGFALANPLPILLAALITIPCSVVALPAYYLAYGLLAQLPGANPSSSSGSGSVSSDGAVTSTTSTGMPAEWFTTITPIIGVGALVAAAIANVFIARAFAAQRNRRGH